MLLNSCAALACSAVALLVWWFAEECIETPAAKHLHLVVMNINPMAFAARDFWRRRGVSEEHTPSGL